MIAKTKIKTGGVNTSDAAIIVYKNSKDELPLIGLEKILYLVIPTSELYIWTGLAYCKINGVLEETLSSLAEKFKNDSELSSSEFAALTLRLNEVDNATLKKFIETYATIESVATSLELAKQELNETLNILSKNLEDYKEEAGKELADLAIALESAEVAIDNVNTNMGDFMKDGVFETAEIAAIGLMYNTLSQSFNALNKEYMEAVDKVESIIEKKSTKQDFDEDIFFKEEFPDFLLMKDIWANEDKDIFINDANINNYISQLSQNNISLSDFNLKSLFNFILLLCLYLPKDKIANVLEMQVWNSTNNKLTEDLNLFKEALRKTLAAIALFDANDELLEAVGNINSVMNGLLNLIDGQIINWNDKGIPLPLYDHETNEWFDGTNWVEEKLTKHQGPSSEWEGKYDLHINDTYVDLITGGAYRWCNTDVGYHWCKITDTATEEVLRKAAELEGALDGKTTTFVLSEPKHPYHKGDLWIVHQEYENYKKGEILNCIKNSENQFNIEDWNRECAYVDQSKVDEAETKAKTYSDATIQTNNLKQLINVNNLICNNRVIYVTFKDLIYRYKPGTLSKICTPNTYTMQFNATHNVSYNGFKVHTLNTNTSESLTWDLIETIDVSMENFLKKEVESGIYKYTIKFTSQQNFNSIAIHFSASERSEITEACLYEDNLSEIMFKPGIPDIDLQALWKNLKLLAKETGVQLTSITPSLPN